MLEASINLLAVLVAGILSTILGGLWYSNFAFGKQWKKLTGVKQGKLPRKRSMALGFLATLFIAYVLALFIDYSEATTFLQGLSAGFQIWLGFIATATLMPIIYEGKSLKLYILNNGYNLLSLLVMGAIIAIWP